MKNTIQKVLLLAFSSVVVTSCQPKINAPKATKGSADFSVYVSLGDGVPAGYSNGAVNLDGQLASFPNILATQFATVGGGEFTQPLVPAGIGYGFEKGQPSSMLMLRDSVFACKGITRLYPGETGTRTIFDIIGFKVSSTGPYNNMAAHASRSIYVNRTTPWISTQSLGGPDTFWKFFATSPTTKSILTEALEKKPTFFTVYLGSTDIYRFAKSGGNQEVAPGATNDDYITPVDVFRDSLNNILTALTATGAKGAIVNLINLESFPYFMYRKYDDLELTVDEARALNTQYASYGFTFNEGRNAYVIKDANAPLGLRRIKSNEYIILQVPQDSLYCYGLGGKVPLGQRWVLDANEIKIVNDNIAAFNTVIKAAADKFGLAFADSNTNMKKIVAGTYYNGISISTNYISGGEFSLDGLNLSPIGQVGLANLVIDAINKKFGSTIPFADPNHSVGINFQ
jgi:lysophospholipase L1-like esterase